MYTMKTILLAIAVLVGCQPEADSSPWPTPSPEIVPFADVSLPQIRTFNETFAPSEELYDLVQEVTGEWATALGRDIRIAEDGIPVELLDTVLFEHPETKELTEVCGLTSIVYEEVPPYGFVQAYRVQISTNEVKCATRKQTVMHELGHTLARRPQRVAQHTTDGLMARNSNFDEAIDADDLEFVCEYSPCD